MADEGQRKPEIALVSMPWPILNRPSIQLGVLKGYVEQHTDTTVATLHPYLQIARALGTNIYATVADNSWAGESLFAALLFPEKFEAARQTFKECLADQDEHVPPFEQLLDSLRKACRDWLVTIPWNTYRLAGFSLCFNQLFASLYLADQVKQLPGCPPILFGGSSCGGKLGRSLLATFSQIDYIIDGEGEIPLAGLCTYLCRTEAGFPERVLARQHHNHTTPAPEITDLNTLPPPDYGPYFAEMRRVFPDTPFIPVLPVEFSRGCWWNKCTFCNLNLQWCGYRYKTHERVLAELKQMTDSRQCLDFTFTDNALPPHEADAFFHITGRSEIDYRFFAEIRGITDPQRLATYRRGGLDTIQVGIEALSSSLLMRMQKGLTAIDNIAMMKHALAADIRLEGNLIMEFPGSTAAEVEETLENLTYVLPFRPLSPATFFLGHDSPIDRKPQLFKIKAVTQHHRNRRLFPPEILRNLSLLVKDYRGDRRLQRQLWLPVREQITLWRQFHQHRRTQSPYPLSYRDGGSFLLIRQERVDGPVLRHRLQGLSRAIYLFCDEIRTIEEICSQFSEVKASAILAFLHQLRQKRLMFREANRVISLALRQQ